ncbi:hypothetical protein [Phreatobacter sp.]|uniref:hypothetical protein n=1 Tax=Phreatobacter sp. TaxID=1966341 RepID=UPI003F6F5589
MTDQYTDIPAAVAVAALGLDRHFDGRTTLWPFDTADQAVARIEADPAMKAAIARSVPDWREAERRKHRRPWVIRHYPTHAVVAGTLDLDAMADSDTLAGIVVDGDLEIFGSLINREPDTVVPFVVVRGCLHCDNLLVAGSDVTVAEHAAVTNLVAITDNQAWVDIGGDVTSRLFIMDSDGFARVGGAVHGHGWSRSRNAELPVRQSDWSAEIRPAYRDAFLDADGEPSDRFALFEALMDGRDLIGTR